MAGRSPSSSCEEKDKDIMVLLDLNDIKKVVNIRDNVQKSNLIESVFGMSVDENSTVSLQRFDVEWGEFVDVGVEQLKDRDKVKVKIVKYSSYTRKVPSSTCIQSQQSMEGELTAASTPLTSNHAGEKAVERLIENLKDHRNTLEYRLQVAQATLSSLREAPHPRAPAGKNTNFTCSNCHYRGHRVNSCGQPPCQGYFECGVSILHKDYREQVKQAEAEVKEVTKLLQKNKDEIDNTRLLKERTKTNFFAVARKKLQNCNPVKYSNRTCLDNDLRILAAACKHKVPKDGVNLEDIIEDHKKNASNLKSTEYTVHENRRGYNFEKPGSYNPNPYHYQRGEKENYMNYSHSWHSPQGHFSHSLERPFRQSPEWHFRQSPEEHFRQSPEGHFRQSPEGHFRQSPEGHFMWQTNNFLSPISHTERSPGWGWTTRQNTTWQHRNRSFKTPNNPRGKHTSTYTQNRGKVTGVTSTQSFSRKKLTYKKPRDVQESSGKKFRRMLNERPVNESQDDDETQDGDESPLKGGNPISVDSPATAQKDDVAGEGKSATSVLPESEEQESQSFNYDKWVQDQKKNLLIKNQPLAMTSTFPLSEISWSFTYFL